MFFLKILNLVPSIRKTFGKLHIKFENYSLYLILTAISDNDTRHMESKRPVFDCTVVRSPYHKTTRMWITPDFESYDNEFCTYSNQDDRL